MVSWVSGGVSGLVRDTGFGPGSEEPYRLLYSPVAYSLASPGSVDLNGITRLQYFAAEGVSFNATVTFNFESSDSEFGTEWGAAAYLAPASAFDPEEVPTPSEILAAATSTVIGDGTFATGDFTVDLFFTDLTYDPNEKFWLMALPYALDTEVPMGAVNDVGRAVSLLTNQSPDAPTITSPTENVIFSGVTANLVYQSSDPDRFLSYPDDIYPFSFADIAGAQIQYAPVPTDLDPTPTWLDLPIVSVGGDKMGRGWHISDADPEPGFAPGESGAISFWTDGKIKIQCGGDPIPRAAYLPVGEWQVRMRTFDYGHPLSTGTIFGTDDSAPPLGDTSGDYTPDTYPEVNTSPWSESVFISAAAQVLPPLPLSPKGNEAVIEGSSVTLVWKYRNTHVPPYAQETRTVQIRRAGDATWTTLVEDQASASASLLVTGFDLVSGNRYEWRVQVTDTEEAESAFSASAFFWMIPEPASGGVIPPAGEIIEGAALGCGTYRVGVYRRGGLVRVGEITSISYLDWDRVRDDISTAKVDVTGWGIDCGNLLAQLQTWAYEIVIFRDNGFSIERVWEGPITLLTYEWDRVVIHAKDVMAYAYRRIIKQALSDFGNSPTAGTSVVARAQRVLSNAFAPDDPNILAYLQPLEQPDDAKQYRSTPAYSRTAFEEVDDMAANAGLDYTTVGRAILLWGTKHRIGTLPEFRDKDLGASPIVSEYGMSMSNRYAISDGNGLHGEATRLNEDEQDPTYGLVEVLSSTWASDSSEDLGIDTEEEREKTRLSFAEAAERSISERYPPPVVVRVPDNTRVNPDTVLSIQHLVPGVVVPLRSTGTLRTVVASQKLDSVKVTMTEGEETITITLSPFSRDDVAAEGGE